jgi:hypothetical protein
VSANGSWDCRSGSSVGRWLLVLLRKNRNVKRQKGDRGVEKQEGRGKVARKNQPPIDHTHLTDGTMPCDYLR